MEEKRTNKHGLWLAPSARREKFVTFSKHSVSYRERIFKRNSHKATRNADSSSHVGQPNLSPQLLAVAFLLLIIVLPPSTDWLILLTSLFCLLRCFPWDLPFSSSSGLVGNLARKPFGWVSRQNRQRESSDWHLPTPNQWIPNIVSHFYYFYNSHLKMREISKRNTCIHLTHGRVNVFLRLYIYIYIYEDY